MALGAAAGERDEELGAGAAFPQELDLRARIGQARPSSVPVVVFECDELGSVAGSPPFNEAGEAATAGPQGPV